MFTKGYNKGSEINGSLVNSSLLLKNLKDYLPFGVVNADKAVDKAVKEFFCKKYDAKMKYGMNLLQQNNHFSLVSKNVYLKSVATRVDGTDDDLSYCEVNVTGTFLFPLCCDIETPCFDAFFDLVFWKKRRYDQTNTLGPISFDFSKVGVINTALPSLKYISSIMKHSRDGAAAVTRICELNLLGYLASCPDFINYHKTSAVMEYPMNYLTRKLYTLKENDQSNTIQEEAK